MEKIDFSKCVFGDLHIHSRFSRACSKDLTIENLVKWARIKGIGLLGTGDFTHPKWLTELKEKLVFEDGIFVYKDEKGKFPFILTSEISLVYSDMGKGRRVHLVYFAPSFDVVDKINQFLDSKGRRDYDGRPIFKITCRDFALKMMEIDKRIEVVPAHIWTSWFGVFGSKGGYNNLDEAFGDQRKNIHAIETGISSNPDMNWRIKDLENTTILSFSDSHSFWPFRIGREATIFRLDKEGKITYDEIIRQIRQNDIIGTIETDPAYGMYHFDGHRLCNFSCDYKKSRELKGICPVCNKELTIGVEYRVEELASKDASPKNKKIFYSILPLHEIISLATGKGMETKSVWDVYDKLIERFGNEFNILLNIEKEELVKIIEGNLADLIIKNRNADIKVRPGYDGTYGEPLLGNTLELKNQEVKIKQDNKNFEIQKKLF